MIPTCLGLIPCTPMPTQAPTGLTLAENQTVGAAMGYLIVIVVVMLVAVAGIAALAFLLAITRE